MRAGSLAMFCALLSVAPPTAQQPRDTVRRTVTGSSSISGVVLNEGSPAHPLRRARVTISGSELELSRSTITTDDGRFSFDSLPAGRYSLSASKDGYPTVAYGAVGPGRPGGTVALAAGEVRQLRIQLPRGAVITGMLRNPQGEPAPAFPVMVLARRFSAATGEHRLMPVANGNVVTDDRGVYRVFGLIAGSYVVSAAPRGPGLQGDIVTPSREDVQRALAEVQERRPSSRSGVSAPTEATPPPPARRGGVALAPTYYPGTTQESRATAVSVAAGEIRTGVDFDLDYVQTASILGSITVLGGRSQLVLSNANPDAFLQTSNIATPGADGAFVFRRVPPGHYVITARAFAAPEGALWGRTEVVVSGDDVEGVHVALEPALTLAGEVVFEGATAPPTLNGLKLPLQVRPRGSGTSPFPIPVAEGSRVVLRGLVPGLYRFISSPQGIRTRVGAWWMKSITMDDREMLDRPLEILPNIRTLRVTFSDQASQLTGIVTHRTGAPVTDSYVVVFSDDPKTWFQYSRRVAGVGLNAEGRYTVWNLPAGNYFVAVSGDLENNEWFDADRLTELRASASRVTIAENQSVIRNITVDQRQP